MQIAYDENKNKVSIHDAIKHHIKCYCTSCNEELVIKNGDINIPHFSHKSCSNCETFTKDMSEWHLNWQEQFPKENREVVIELDVKEDEYRKGTRYLWRETLEEYNDFCDRENRNELKTFHIKHRADVCVNGFVIEFQHSSISEQEFLERNWFYTLAGYKLIWVFDFREQILNENMQFERITDYGGMLYSWKRHKKFLDNIVPQKSHAVKLIFETGYAKNGIEQLFYVDWASPNREDDDFADFRRFIIHDIVKDIELKRIVGVTI